MLKYAKITDKETKKVSIGSRLNTDFYKSIGMTEMEVEQDYAGNWYVSGYAPEKPQEVIKEERIAELHQLLADADYWGQKYLDGEYTAEEWAEKVAIRKAWREELRKLEKN